ncbi:MAG TPA: hypothetical protein VIP46_17080 [Pyrinomonadaceae bacterium]
MKYFIALLVTLGCACASYSQPRSDAEKAGLLGRVKSVEFGRIKYALRDGRGVEGRKIPVQLTAFNEDGATAEVTSFKEDGSISGKTGYLYDDQGRNVGTETNYSMGQGAEERAYKQRIVYTLDERGNRAEEVGYQTDGTVSHRHLFKYDARGKQVEALYYSWNGTRVGKIVYTYDERGNELTQTSYNADDSVAFKTASTYDARGNKIEWVQHIGETLRYRVIHRYDEKSRLKERETIEYGAEAHVCSSHAPVPGKVVFTYDDEKGAREEATYDAAGVLTHRVVAGLDGKGNEIARAELASDGSPKCSKLSWYDEGKLVREMCGEPSTKFEYDAKGNWTRKTFFLRPASGGPEAYGAEYRTITYY